MLHRTRHLLIRQQTAVINSIRDHLAAFGIVGPVGRNGVEALLAIVADPNDKRLPGIARVWRCCRHSATGTESADSGVRSDDHGLAPIQRDQQAPRRDSRGRTRR
jgi:hypothetical protein